MASSYYANETTQWLLQQKITLVPKQINPPNVPTARPIEDFWSILAGKIYEEGWEVKTELQLKKIISSEDKTNGYVSCPTRRRV